MIDVFYPVRALRAMMRRAEDRGFDRRAGLDTGDYIPPNRLNLPDECGPDALAYQASGVGDFRRILRAARVIPARTSFIDLGSGKGRALLIAAEAGFARVVGVEADPQLCAVARRNIEQWRARRTTATPLETVEADARSFDFPPGDLLVYLFNPFEGAVFDAVVTKLTALAADPDRQLVVAYNNNRLANRLDATVAFERQDLRPRLPWRPSTVSLHRPRR